MFTLKGKYGNATVMTDNVAELTIQQIIEFLNEDFTKDVRVAIMPDTHAGKNAVIGTTMEVKNKLVPNLVGSDIGCGVMCIEINPKGVIDLQVLDETIKSVIPLGAAIHEKPQKEIKNLPLNKLICLQKGDDSHLWKSMGTLGGGNHFIELGKHDGRYFLTIHTGSRSIGTIVCKYHQKRAYTELRKEKNLLAIEKIKESFPKSEWQKQIENLKHITLHVKKEMAALEGEYLKDYLHDLDIAQQFAKENRNLIAKRIIDAMGWEILDQFDSVHNYVDIQHMILRKGAISAREGERIIVPINMRDGSIVAVGKGNDDWNQSAPHGAGRLLSRSQAKAKLDVEEFKETMKGVYSSTVGLETLDEAPDAYKSMDEIIEKTKDTMDTLFTIKPIYNVKG